MNKKNIIKLILASLILKISYLIFASFVLNNSSILSFSGYTNIAKRNDTGWYEKITANWYPEITDKRDLGYSDGPDFKQSEWAFFPLYPGLNRMFIKFFNVDFNLSGFIWSIVFSTLSFIGFYFFCVLYSKDTKRSFYYSLVFLLLPFHYYFSMMYTEAVYFTFLIFSFISIYKQKYLLLPFCIIPLILVRPNSIISLIAIYVYFLEMNNILSKNHLSFKLFFSKTNILKSLIFLVGPITFFLYCFYQKQMTGYYFAFSIAQAGWYKEFMFPFLSFFRRSDFATQFNSVYTILTIVYSILIYKKLPLSLNIFIWLSLILPLCSGSVTSMTRYISVIFPLSVLFGSWLYNLKYRYVLLIFLFSIQLFVFYYWIVYTPFSY